jgi:hypothetical protein
VAPPSDHWLSPPARWVLAHGDALVPVAFVLMALLLAALLALAWLQGGARLLVAVWVWRRAWAWWRGRRGASGGRPGGAGGPRGHSEHYRRVMGSAGWRRRRRQVLRRQGGRCAVPGCTQRAVDVHHAAGYARLGRERPDELLGVCERHHRQLHGR